MDRYSLGGEWGVLVFRPFQLVVLQNTGRGASDHVPMGMPAKTGAESMSTFCMEIVGDNFNCLTSMQCFLTWALFPWSWWHSCPMQRSIQQSGNAPTSTLL